MLSLTHAGALTHNNVRPQAKPCADFDIQNRGRPRPTMSMVPRQFVYDTSSTDISSTTVYQGTVQLYIQLLFQQIIIFINSNFYLRYDSCLSIPLPLTL